MVLWQAGRVIESRLLVFMLTMISIREASSESWFEELDQLNEVLSGLPEEIGRAHKRVRVAVIDTGINSSDPYARHIQGYRDFVTNNDDLKQDNTGHGTNSVKLIYKVYAEAEVYVARVFEYDEADDCTQDLMLKVRTTGLADM